MFISFLLFFFFICFIINYLRPRLDQNWRWNRLLPQPWLPYFSSGSRFFLNVTLDSDQQSRFVLLRGRLFQGDCIFEGETIAVLSDEEAINKIHQLILLRKQNYWPPDYGILRGELCSNRLERNGIVFAQFRCPIGRYLLAICVFF